MAIGDLVSKATIVFKADTADMKRALKDLSAEERKAHEARLKQAEESNARMESGIKTLAKMGAAVGALGLAWKAASSLISGSIEHTRLAAVTANVDMDKLRKASLGLRTDMDLLRQAAALNAGEFKKTSAELAAAEGAIRALQNRGVDLAKATDVVTKAMVELKINGLQDLGIGLDLTKKKTDTAAQRLEMFGDVMKVVNSLADESSKRGTIAGESWQQAAVSAQNAWHQFRLELVQSFDITEAGVKRMADNAKRYGQLGGVNPFSREALERAELYASGYDEDKVAHAVRTADALKRLSDSLLRDAQIQQERFGTLTSGILGGAAGGAAGAARARQGGGGPQDIPYRLGGTVLGEGNFFTGSISPFGEIPLSDVSSGISSQALAAAGVHDRFMAELAEHRAAGESFMERTFGPLQEINAYGEAFSALTDGLKAGFAAWIDGSKSVSAAFRDALREGLKASATEMFGESIKHSAYALGSLAFGRFDKAAFHAKAAAAHAAGAAVLGGLAKAAYGGGGGSSGATAPGGGVPAISGGTQAQGDQGRTVVIAYGQDFSEDSARQRQLRAARVLEDARQAGGMSGVTHA